MTLGWLFTWEHWLGENGIFSRLGEHLAISLAAVIISMLIAIPLGVLIGHTRKGTEVMGAFTGATRAIPTLGIITVFGLFLGIGVVPPLAALVVLAIPSLLAASYSGIQSVNQLTVDAAQAIGMNGWEVIKNVELPLSMPVLVGGIRIATLQVVSTATFAAYTSDLGLGRFLFLGLKTRDYPQMLGAAVLVIVLAIILEMTLAFVQRLSRPSHEK
ncbi:ABC transporter permease [Arcanobacterium ihumii]|uniref:ABC transporter permease n=1 Tax=Arcanobacterium ihumii TaxID=2138162 RepID=UPI000F53AE15|nr:ABC transporter permease [Arcanobacterium ihumii]